MEPRLRFLWGNLGMIHLGHHHGRPDQGRALPWYTPGTSHGRIRHCAFCCCGRLTLKPPNVGHIFKFTRKHHTECTMGPQRLVLIKPNNPSAKTETAETGLPRAEIEMKENRNNINKNRNRTKTSDVSVSFSGRTETRPVSRNRNRYVRAET